MNDTPELLYRLLKLFSVKEIKSSFNIEGANQSEVIRSIIQQNTEIGIKRFAVNNIDTTKQHIYFYNLQYRFDRQSFDENALPFPLISEELNNGVYKFKLLPLIDHNIVKTNPFEQDMVQFYQPVVLTFHNRLMYIQFTILEKNIGSYLDEDRKVINVEKALDEEALKNDLIAFVSQTSDVSVCDLNRGVKQLWHNQVIDSKYAKYKKNRSTAVEMMDGTFTLREEYPEVYNELVATPLHKMVFKYKRDDEAFCDHFTLDPTKGELSIPIFPNNSNNVNQVQNVISEIIRNN